MAVTLEEFLACAGIDGLDSDAGLELLSSKGRRFALDDAGQGLVEYSLIIALVALIAIVALRTLGRKANNTLNNAASNLS
jgi:pilus assembly protein Flp/PilA